VPRKEISTKTTTVQPMKPYHRGEFMRAEKLGGRNKED
jgi:hypothetical protein